MIDIAWESYYNEVGIHLRSRYVWQKIINPYVVRKESAGIQFDPGTNRLTVLKVTIYESHRHTTAKYADIIDFKEER